jgi:uncharacterized protein (TIGR02147 family)
MAQVPESEREIGALTLSASAEVAERLQQDVRLFRRYATFLSEQCEKPDRVVQLNMQLFAVTKS